MSPPDQARSQLPEKAAEADRLSRQDVAPGNFYFTEF
jgi:hypothetical protein